MTRRQVYKMVESTAARAGGDEPLLAAALEAMRLLRGRSTQDTSPLARHLLDDPQFRLLLGHDDALGQIYQAMNAPKLEAAYRSARRDRTKFQLDELPAVTQLFTPRWVVEFLLQKTLWQTWLQMHEPEQAHTRLPKRVIDIRLIDPACGTMNFALVAVDLFRRMYQEEMDQAGRAGWPAEPSVRSLLQIDEAIAKHNLFGIDIDAGALRLAAAGLELKLGSTTANLRQADALFDCEGNRESFDIVVTNPPFLSSRNLPIPMVTRLKRAYPHAWRDACACFLERALSWLKPGGRAGVLTMQSFMFTGAFERFRAFMNEVAAVESIAHFGPGIFDVGNPGTLRTAAIALRREPDRRRREDQDVEAFRLIEVEDKQAALRERVGAFHLSQREMSASPRGAWIYWLPTRAREAFRILPRLREVSPPRQGLATTDNARFVRYWWEVKPANSAKWIPYAKSGRFRRWYEAPRHRVNWENDGEEIKQSIIERYPYLDGKWSWVAKNSSFYGREGVTYSYLTCARFSARRLDAGAIFDVAGSALFPEDALTMLAVLNSSTARTLLEAINPTVNFQVGDLAELPMPRESPSHLREDVLRLIELHQLLDRFDETTTDFVSPMPWDSAGQIFRETHQEISKLERRIDGEVSRIYGLSCAAETATASIEFDHRELAQRWVSFHLRRILDSTDEPLQIRPIDRTLERTLRQICGSAIDEAVGGIGRFIAEDLFRWHLRLYECRPVMWVLGDCRRQFLVRHDMARAAVVSRLLKRVRATLPDRWDRFPDDGIKLNLAPLHAHVPQRQFARVLAQLDADLRDGRYAWSETAMRMFSPAPSAGFVAVRRPGSAARLRAAAAAART